MTDINFLIFGGTPNIRCTCSDGSNVPIVKILFFSRCHIYHFISYDKEIVILVYMKCTNCMPSFINYSLSNTAYTLQFTLISINIFITKLQIQLCMILYISLWTNTQDYTTSYSMKHVFLMFAFNQLVSSKASPVF